MLCLQLGSLALVRIPRIFKEVSQNVHTRESESICLNGGTNYIRKIDTLRGGERPP